jgi:hypothetical protein
MELPGADPGGGRPPPKIGVDSTSGGHFIYFVVLHCVLWFPPVIKKHKGQFKYCHTSIILIILTNSLSYFNNPNHPYK